MERGAYALWKESTTHVILSLEFLTWWIIQDSWVRSLKHWALLRKYDSSKNKPYPTLEVFILFETHTFVWRVQPKLLGGLWYCLLLYNIGECLCIQRLCTVLPFNADEKLLRIDVFFSAFKTALSLRDIAHRFQFY